MRHALRMAAIGAPMVLSCVTAGCQSAKPAVHAAAAPSATSTAPLQTYTASDQSASAGVPAGWQVTQGANTVIRMTGPQGVSVSLGNTFIARNAAFQAGQRSANGVDLSMPYAASLAQKLTMLVEQGAALSGKPLSQMAINSSTPIQLPAALGQCARMVASYTGDQGPVKMMVVFCSLPLDSGGDYKNIMLEAEGPAAVAAQAVPTVQTIFRSYNLPPAWLQRKLAPQNAPPAAAMTAGQAGAIAGINAATNYAARSADVNANCFDLSVLRETPTYELPRSCGGTRPD
jgi:hypothetical protein